MYKYFTNKTLLLLHNTTYKIIYIKTKQKILPLQLTCIVKKNVHMIIIIIIKKSIFALQYYCKITITFMDALFIFTC